MKKNVNDAMAGPVPLGAEKILVPPKRSVARAIALDLWERAGIQLESRRPVRLYVVDEENWVKLRAGQPFRAIIRRLVHSGALAFKATSAGVSHIVVHNPGDTAVRVTLLISI